MTMLSFVYENAQVASAVCAPKTIELLAFTCNVHLLWVDERSVPAADSSICRPAAPYRISTSFTVAWGRTPVWPVFFRGIL